MKKTFNFLILALLFFSCTDDAAEKLEGASYVNATIDSVSWESTDTYALKTNGENGPLIIVGKGDKYTLELALGGISEPGEYQMGANRSGKIKYGNNNYTTLDVQEAGKIIITRYEENRVEGQFLFDAQWLSANSRLEVRNGDFKVTFY